MVKGQTLRKKDMVTKSNLDLFLELYEAEWSKKVTSHALQNLSFKKHNKPQMLPLTNDLLALRNFLTENIAALTEEVRKNAMKENWRRLAVLALARLIIFNERSQVTFKIHNTVIKFIKCSHTIECAAL